ncbi:JAB domain-containing protein [Eupransor demetentiae]|uniref:Contains a helix-hairpin-helix DNA-binding motif (RadC) n=1 Tax=Eupransor demetentiae TaxID=3109584 RepID=A0ABP0ETP4_9LACO|nr:DNA repair protein RadC [Lactobacillaceae bacterium LMG 33000]
MQEQVEAFYRALDEDETANWQSFHRYFPQPCDLNEITVETGEDFISHNPQANRALLIGIELGRRAAFAKRPSLVSARHSADFGRFAQRELGRHHQEVLYLALVNTQLEVMAFEVVFVGTLTHVVVSPREIFQRALQLNAYGMLLVHNHPSGNVHPSQYDLDFSQKLYQLGQKMDLPLIDSFVVTGQEYWSMQENQQLKKQDD